MALLRQPSEESLDLYDDHLFYDDHALLRRNAEGSGSSRYTFRCASGTTMHGRASPGLLVSYLTLSVGLIMPCCPSSCCSSSCCYNPCSRLGQAAATYCKGRAAGRLFDVLTKRYWSMAAAHSSAMDQDDDVYDAAGLEGPEGRCDRMVPEARAECPAIPASLLGYLAQAHTVPGACLAHSGAITTSSSSLHVRANTSTQESSQI